MSDGVFITGTGTDVGKTIVTSGIFRYLRRQGLDAVTMKPIQTGADTSVAPWKAPDLEVHWQAAAFEPGTAAYSDFCPYLYEPACSPHLAARLAGEAIDISILCAAAAVLQARHEYVLIEGAGGIHVPINDHVLTLELMRQLACPVILVGHVALGAINHTLLSLEVLQRAGLEVAGIVLSTPGPQPESSQYILDDNPAAIECFTDVPILGVVPWLADISHSGAPGWDTFDAAMDWELLLKQLGLWHD